MAQRRSGGPWPSPSNERRLAEEFDLALSAATADGSGRGGSGKGSPQSRRRSYDEPSYDEASYNGGPSNGPLDDGRLNGAAHDGYDARARRQSRESSSATPADPINSLVALTRRVEGAGTALPGMDEAFRAQLRARLVRLTPELAAAPAKGQVPAQRGGRHAGLRKPVTARPSHSGGGISASWRRRLLAAGVGVAVATGSVGGIAIASAGAVPGDPLYSAKKMFENIQLSLSGSPTDRGGEYLKLADTRLSEIEALLSRRDADVPGSPTTAYLDQDLTDLQTMIADGGNVLLGQVRTQGDQQAVHLLSDFLLTERQRVADLAWQLPLTLQNRPTHIVATMDALYLQLQAAVAALPPPGSATPTPSTGPQPDDGTNSSAGTGQGGSTSASHARGGRPGDSHGVSPSGQRSAGASGSPGASPSASPSASTPPPINVHLPLPILPSISIDLPPLLILPGINLGLGGSGSNPSATPGH